MAEPRRNGVSIPLPAMKGLSIGQIIVLLLALGVAMVAGYVGVNRRFLAPPAAPTYQTQAVGRGTIEATVSTTGSVAVVQQAKLSFETSGRLVELNVRIGSSVKAGDVLARLDTADLEVQVAQAELSLRTAQLKLEQIKAGATEAELTSAQLTYEKALTDWRTLQEGPKETDLRSAQTSVLSAQNTLQKGQQDLADLLSKPTERELNAAKAALESSEISLVEAQTAYDKVVWRADITARKEAMNLWKATTAYEAAKADYELKVAGPTADEIAQARRAVEIAQANQTNAEVKLADLQAGPTADTLRAAQLNLANAKARLDEVRSKPAEIDVVTQEQQVRQAELTLAQRRRQLEGATIRAPFDGYVSALTVNVGEQVSGAIMTLQNLDQLVVNANVDETDTPKLAVGQTARVTVEAFSDRPLSGKVIAIAPSGQTQQGVVLYPVTFSVDRSDVPVRVGMNATVQVIVDQRQNVLLAPNRAVQTQGRERYVQVLVDGKPQRKAVQVGLSDSQFTEIRSGLSLGEAVVVPETTVTASTRGAPGLGGLGGTTGMGGFTPPAGQAPAKAP
ncbi:MAG: efflux RND transporter periplasmic adaptor subunit [Chloroflexi bacterium]|nr:efflux RND transporter periplasmic adaptor subunit [Chloroflexota bacterium]